jgi:NAD(P)-dependent dehydrogenase (short-subunit alcohol dehydrogenase family)
VPYDLGSPESIETAVAAVATKWGRIDVFVANAICWPPSFEPNKLFHQTTDAGAWQQLLRSNIVRRQLVVIIVGLI